MSADPDSCLPQPVKNFVFDLHDSAFRSLLVSEQASLYNGTFRDLSSKVRDDTYYIIFFNIFTDGYYRINIMHFS